MTQPFESFGVRETPIAQAGYISDPTAVVDSRGLYGYINNGYDQQPDQLARSSETAGGFLFFPNDVPAEFVDGLIAVAGLASTAHTRANRYAVRVTDAIDVRAFPKNYLRKLVIADRSALLNLYSSVTPQQYDAMPEQPLDVAELVRLFFEDERTKHDADIEKLGFGFAIEHHRHGVISVWSRALDIKE